MVKSKSPTNKSALRLSELVEFYSDYNTLRPATITCYRQSVKSLQTFLRQDMFVADITHDLLIGWRRYSLANFKPVTWNSRRRPMALLLSFLSSQGLLDENPMVGVKGAKTPKMVVRTVPDSFIEDMERYFAEYEMQQSIGKLTQRLPAWICRTIVHVFYRTAMRRRQLVGLTWGDVQLTSKNFRLVTEFAKSKRERELAIDARLIPMLKELKDRSIEAGGLCEASDPLFKLNLWRPRGVQQLEDEHVSTRRINTIFTHLSKGIGYRVTPHMLRHTCATQVSKKTANLRVVQELLGHSDVATTMVYLHASPANVRDALARVA